MYNTYTQAILRTDLNMLIKKKKKERMLKYTSNEN